MIRTFRKTHLSELQALAQLSGASLGYGSQKAGAEGGAKGGQEDSSMDEEEGEGAAGGDGTGALPAAA